MTAVPDKTDLMKKALIELRRLRAENTALKKALREPIAIIGMGCRFPGGADDPDSFWDLLSQGRDGISEVPPDRWDIDAYYDPDPDAPGRMYTRHGGFIGSLDGFDAPFFNISPREAASLDPKQRLVLEVGWECLEHAGLAPDRLYGSRTGVYVGIGNFDYLTLQLRVEDPEAIDTYFTTGGSLCVAAGRLSYLLGLNGPSMIVDTACSSSLVAVHLACRSLRQKECDLALAGGVNTLLAPEVSVNFCRARMLSTDGRCKTFDASADGYVRAEGCGMIALKRLSDARADNDTILGLIRGTAVNQDGASGGLAVPSGPSQEKVIREALADGGLEPGEITYMEAHGTGTSLGDPIEMGAIGQVFNKRETDLIVGSVKSNIGHLEPAAGISGLIKTVLALNHREIPANLHFHSPNPGIDWAGLKVTVPTRPIPWPKGETPRAAGVSSFGFSGTNAHAVIQEAPLDETEARRENIPDPPVHLLALSARTETALLELAERYRNHLETHASISLGDIAFTAAVGRTHFNHRLALVADPASIRTLLASFLDGKTAPGIRRGTTRTQERPVFAFPDLDALYPAMGKAVYDNHPGFRDLVDRCGRVITSSSETPLREFPLPDQKTFSRTERGLLSALFSLEVALARLWQEWNVRPGGLSGSGIGEYAAACVAGVFSLEDGLKLCAARERVTATRDTDPGALSAFRKSVQEITLSPPRVPLLSPENKPMDSHELTDPEFWVHRMEASENAETPIFQAGPDDHRTVLVMGPVPETRKTGSGETAGCLASLSQGREWQTLLESLGDCYVSGISVDWSAVYRVWPRRRVSLPTYPFQKKRYWLPERSPLSQETDTNSASGKKDTSGHTKAVSPCLYELSWIPAPPDSESAPLPSGRWLIIADRTGVVSRELAALLTKQGMECRVMNPPGTYDELRRKVSEAMPAAGVIFLPGLDLGAGYDQDPCLDTLDEALAVVNVLAETRNRHAARLWFVTCGAMTLSKGPEPVAAGQAGLWGLARNTALEHAFLRCSVIDLDPAGDAWIPHSASHARTIVDALGIPGEDRLAWRGTRCYVPRLKPAETWTMPEQALSGFKKEATYLITGGLGGLGLTMARWMAAQGAGNLVLTGRTPASADAKEKLRAIEALGASVTVMTGDIASETDTRNLMETLAGTLPPLKGIIHAAGILDPGKTQDLSREGLLRVMAPKATGAWHLHRFSRDLSLDFFVLFSSAASLLGYLGQTGYVAANAILDALAHQRRQEGLPATAIGWGPWTGVGIAASRSDEEKQALRWGMRYIRPEHGPDLLLQMLHEDAVHRYALDIDWDRYAGLLSRVSRNGLFSGLFPNTGGLHVTSEDSRGPDIPEELKRMPRARRPAALLKTLQALAAAVIHFDNPEEIAVDQPLMEQGFDSLMAVELTRRLGKAAGSDLPVSLPFDYPTLEKMRDYLLEEILFPDSAGEPSETEPDSDSQSSGDSLLDDIEALIRST